MALPARAQFVVIGGGIIGCSTAYHLAREHRADVVLLEQGKLTSLCHLARSFGESGGKVVSATRHTPNPLRAHADHALLVSAHDDARHVEPLLYQAALQQLLDLVFLRLCADESRRMRLDDYREPVRSLLDE